MGLLAFILQPLKCIIRVLTGDGSADVQGPVAHCTVTASLPGSEGISCNGGSKGVTPIVSPCAFKVPCAALLPPPMCWWRDVAVPLMCILASMLNALLDIQHLVTGF